MCIRIPPGPHRDLFIGAMRSFPKEYPIKRFKEWANKYGEIVYAPLPGINMVILNSYEIAHEFLSKNSSYTAGRSVGYLVANLMEGEWGMGFMPPGAHHANQRKMLRRAIGPQRVGIHDSLIESEAVKLMPALNAFQGNPNDEFEPRIGHLISKATYGDRIWAEMGENLSHWNIVFTSLASEGLFGLWLVNIFHFLRFIPDWVPGLRFKQAAREGGDLSRKIRDTAYNRGVELHKSGKLDHSILNDLLDEFGESADTQDATGVLYTTGTDTSTAGIIQFLHVLFLFPDVCERVFEEIRGVTQGLRLPRISDRPQLPYTDAVWKEAVRWRPFVPLGIPHVSSRDEIVKGYFVPKGTLIHQNTIAMLNDPKIWEDPDAFRPERFLEPSAGQTLNPHTIWLGNSGMSRHVSCRSIGIPYGGNDRLIVQTGAIGRMQAT